MGEVTQADRDAAAKIAEECNPELEFLPETYRAGDLDSAPLVQAFAAHREAATCKEGLQVEVREIETVTGDFMTERGAPFWRIEIDGYCADFDYQAAAENFAAAINSRIAARPAGDSEAEA